MKRRSGMAVGMVMLVLAGGVAAGCGDDSSDEAGASSSKGLLTVAAASDLRPAFTELGELYTEQTGTPVTFSFGSSGQLAQQITNGAPFDFFASASTGFVDDVLKAGVGDEATKKTYAFGRLVIWSPDRKYTQLSELAADDVRKVAIANPEHAPYGKAAEEALTKAGLLDAVKPKLVLGENISDTQRLVSSGNAEVGIIALSLAIASKGKWTLVAEDQHNPLEQASIVTARDDAATKRAVAFSTLLNGPEGREIMKRYGFLLPGEELDRDAAAASGGDG